MRCFFTFHVQRMTIHFFYNTFFLILACLFALYMCIMLCGRLCCLSHEFNIFICLSDKHSFLRPWSRPRMHIKRTKSYVSLKQREFRIVSFYFIYNSSARHCRDYIVLRKGNQQLWSRRYPDLSGLIIDMMMVRYWWTIKRPQMAQNQPHGRC